MLVTFPLFVPMVCRNICERIYSKIVVDETSHITSLVRNIVEDASVTLSLKIYFVNVAGCSYEVVWQKENAKKN